jgi:hypothetical protein
METQCERRGQVEVGIVTHDGLVYAALGSRTKPSLVMVTRASPTTATTRLVTARHRAARTRCRPDTNYESVNNNLSQYGETT